jgi:ribosomal protein L7Ae-like RNA K-turn-binding protein
MKFYCIFDNESQDSIERSRLLEEACKKKNIEFVKILPDTFHYVNDTIEKGSLLYRATPGKNSRILERHLLDDSIVSLYKNLHFGVSGRDHSYFFNQKCGLPIIKTIPDLCNNKKVLQEYVESLGGFPVVVKVLGGSHGVGVMKIDSIEALVSIADFFKSKGIHAILRKFIPHTKQARIIVLGDKVLSSHINLSSTDFRSNVGENTNRQRTPFTFPEEIQDIAIKAVHSIGIEFGGVDILFEEETNQPHIAEVNFPCFFPTAQSTTGVNIADSLVEYLLEKSKRGNSIQG